MGSAIVVFSDGSKRLAHNLDDQRVRWHERRNWIAELEDEGIAIPTGGNDRRAIPNALSQDDMRALRETYRAQARAIHAEIDRTKLVGEYTTEKRRALQTALSVVSQQVQAIKLLHLAIPFGQVASEQAWLEAQLAITERITTVAKQREAAREEVTKRKIAETEIRERALVDAQPEITKRRLAKEERLRGKERAYADYVRAEKNAMLNELRRLKQMHEETGAIDCVNIPQSKPFVWSADQEAE